MLNIKTLNNISDKGLERLSSDLFAVGDDIDNPDAILLRSFKMHDMEMPSNLKAVGRAGAGVNNIPVDALSKLGIPVFNAPGANANAVKELVVAGLLLAARNICQAWDYTRQLEGNDAELSKQVEAGKKTYGGFELPGRTLGVVGLGAIGRYVANIALDMGMKVIGFDPGITIEGAWQLSASVKKAGSIEELLRNVDFITFHVPLVDATRDMINAERIKMMRDGATVLNFARDGIVNDEAIVEALKSGKLHAYVCDFPSNTLMGQDRVIALPHLGASTGEAEDNCAIMVADQVKDFLLTGNIKNSVNFPEVIVPFDNQHRVVIANANVPKMLGHISNVMADANLNIHDMVNKSRDELAYTVVDCDSEIPAAVADKLRAVEGVLSVRVI
ncbi:MAG: phosphoglycerate dehydrogenase [Acidiferrobacterales bacterium]